MNKEQDKSCDLASYGSCCGAAGLSSGGCASCRWMGIVSGLVGLALLLLFSVL